MKWPFKKKQKMISPQSNYRGTRLTQSQYDELIAALDEGLPPEWNPDKWFQCLGSDCDVQLLGFSGYCESCLENEQCFDDECDVCEQWRKPNGDPV